MAHVRRKGRSDEQCKHHRIPVRSIDRGNYPTVRARQRATLIPPTPDAHVIHASATAANEAIVLWEAKSNPSRWTITRQLDTVIQIIEVDAPSSWQFPVVQAMPDGGALIAKIRCGRRDGLLEHNARHIDSTGQLVRSATLGDGIEHMLTDSLGNVWVGFFDEGIYGDVGWEDEGHGSIPIGGPGLLRFDRNLSLAWSYSRHETNHDIDDCYALNVSDEAVFTCAYSDFVIAKIVAGEIEYWPNEIAGARAILVNGNSCALVGGYKNMENRLVEGHLGADGFTPQRLGLIETGVGPALPRKVWTVGRGAELHVFDNLDWYRWTLGSRTS
jgi:hypothetical protein